MLSRERRVHQGIGFDLWTGQRSWFWKLADRGAIGVAISQPQAVSEACSAIDELLGCDIAYESRCGSDSYYDRWHCALDRLCQYVTTP
jgi:hypothetical protein